MLKNLVIKNLKRLIYELKHAYLYVWQRKKCLLRQQAPRLQLLPLSITQHNIPHHNPPLPQTTYTNGTTNIDLTTFFFTCHLFRYTHIHTHNPFCLKIVIYPTSTHSNKIVDFSKKENTFATNVSQKQKRGKKTKKIKL